MAAGGEFGADTAAATQTFAVDEEVVPWDEGGQIVTWR
jgi:hypothetical protein